MQRVEADRRDGLPADADLPVVARRVPGHARLGGQGGPHLGRRYPGELQVQLFGPVLAITMRGAGQLDEAGAEHPGRDHRRDRGRGGDQRAAGRDGGPAVTGLERHPGPERPGDRARQGQPRSPARPVGPADRAGRLKRAAGPGRRPPRHRDQQGHRQECDRGQPGTQQREVGRDAGARLGQAGRAYRHQRRGRDGHGHREAGGGHGHRGDPGQGQCGQAAAGHAQRAQGGEAGRVQDELAAQQLGQDRQPDQAGQRREDGQRDHLRPGGLLGRGHLGGQAHHGDPAGRRVTPGQRGRGPAERRQADPRAQAHARVIPGAELAARAAAPESGAQQDPRRAVEAGGGHHLVVEGDDRRHPEGQRDRPGAAGRGRAAPGGTGLGGAGVAEQAQGATGPHMRGGGEFLVDHDRPRVGGVERPPGQHPHPVGGRAEGAVRAGDGLELRSGRRRRGQGERIHHAGPDGRHLRQVGEPAVEPAQAGAVGDDLHAGGVGPAEQPGIGGVGAPGAGRGGQHHTADQPQQQRESQHGPPAQPQIGPQREPHRPGGPQARCLHRRPPVIRRAGRWPA